MGTLPEQGTPFIGQRTSFAAAYPTVETAIVRYTEADFGMDPKENVHNLATSGPRVACRNPLCHRGGYDFESLVMLMVSQGTESKTMQMSCNGDEGTPKGRRRGRDCSMSITGMITIAYKKQYPSPK